MAYPGSADDRAAAPPEEEWDGFGYAASIWRRPAPVWGLAHQIRRWPKGLNMF